MLCYVHSPGTFFCVASSPFLLSVIIYTYVSRIFWVSSANVFTLLRIYFKWNVFIFIDDFIIIDLIFRTVFCHLAGFHLCVFPSPIILIVSRHAFALCVAHSIFSLHNFGNFTNWVFRFYHFGYLMCASGETRTRDTNLRSTEKRKIWMSVSARD